MKSEVELSPPSSPAYSRIVPVVELRFSQVVQHKIKYGIDRLAGLVLLVLLSPVFLVVYVLTLIQLGRPVMYCQERMGCHGKRFRMYKFRTMSDERDAEGNLLPDSVRIRPFTNLIRRMKLDEIPQFIHLLTGEMSLVGPRPLIPCPDDQLSKDAWQRKGIHYALSDGLNPLEHLRLEMRPGLTGWAQVNGNANLKLDQRFALDGWYVLNSSLLLDLKILMWTVVTLVIGEKIRQNHISEALRCVQSLSFPMVAEKRVNGVQPLESQAKGSLQNLPTV